MGTGEEVWVSVGECGSERTCEDVLGDVRCVSSYIQGGVERCEEVCEGVKRCVEGGGGKM